MKKMSVDEMRQVELQIMDEIHRVCQEQGITYFLFFGSLLGARRHGGFIPWDDDVDIVMLRDDYERFLACFGQAGHSDRFALAHYRDGKAPFTFAKVVDTTTKVCERYAREEYCTGVWVDVFPLDYFDPAFTAAKKHIDRYALTRTLIMTRTDTGTNALVRLGKKIVCPFLQGKDPVKYCQLIDDESRRLASGRADLVANAVSACWNEVFPTQLFECEPAPIAFEDREYLTIADPDRALELMYGDWQTPPPEREREMHAAAAYFL